MIHETTCYVPDEFVSLKENSKLCVIHKEL